ncbi:MAG TPA: signal peptidase II [Firmicutes bacterium]|nr:signal peptidase II [Bacillota bacterium]
MKGWIGGIAMVAGIDQISKALALAFLKPVGSMTVLPGVFDLTFVENRGAAFGMLQGQRWLFLALTVVVTVAVIYYVKKTKLDWRQNRLLSLSLVLLMGGAWGNAIDRLFRGYVVDYFEITLFEYPVFNVADIGVVAGAIGIAIALLFFQKNGEERHG